ncbi:MAG: diacylglycerol kinase family protein [Verrucomicrobiota bacterium]
MKAVLIFNPGSGRGQGKERADAFAASWLRRIGTRLQLRATTSREDIGRAALEVDQDAIPLFMGGDGTLSEGLNALASAGDFFQTIERPVGFLPGGTGNSFLRDFGIEDFATGENRLLAAIEENCPRPCDAMGLTYLPDSCEDEIAPARRHLAINIWGLGLLATIAERAVTMRRFGAINYVLATLREVIGHVPSEARFRINGGDWECLRFNLIALSNSQFTGGGMRIAPGVEIDDGELAWLRSNLAGKRALLRAFLQVRHGNHSGQPGMEERRVRRVEIEKGREPVLMNVDGEQLRGRALKVEVLPKCFRLYV